MFAWSLSQWWLMAKLCSFIARRWEDIELNAHTKCFYCLVPQFYVTCPAYRGLISLSFAVAISVVLAVALHLCSVTIISIWHEPQQNKINKISCAPSKDSDQPGHPPSLIWVFAVRTKKHWWPWLPIDDTLIKLEDHYASRTSACI